MAFRPSARMHRNSQLHPGHSRSDAYPQLYIPGGSQKPLRLKGEAPASSSRPGLPPSSAQVDGTGRGRGRALGASSDPTSSAATTSSTSVWSRLEVISHSNSASINCAIGGVDRRGENAGPAAHGAVQDGGGGALATVRRSGGILARHGVELVGPVRGPAGLTVRRVWLGGGGAWAGWHSLVAPEDGRPPRWCPDPRPGNPGAAAGGWLGGAVELAPW
jgi:hypothetical protein